MVGRSIGSFPNKFIELGIKTKREKMRKNKIKNESMTTTTGLFPRFTVI